MGGRLFLYALKNRELTAGSSRTVCAISQDGKASSEFTEIESKAWLFWRPKSRDGQTWFVPAYWHEHGKATLLQSRDGIHWSIVATIHEGARTDETDIEFLPDRRMLVTSRPEFSDNYLGGSRGGTLVTESGPPYDTRRETAPSKVTRLDGRHLFKYQGRIHGVGRCQPDVEGPFTWPGSILSRKRTALFRVAPGGLARLTDLPSSGDTACEGLVVRGETAYISCYTSPISKDYPWILGMVRPSDARMGEVNLASLASVHQEVQ